jgi:hypothetical protein
MIQKSDLLRAFSTHELLQCDADIGDSYEPDDRLRHGSAGSRSQHSIIVQVPQVALELVVPAFEPTRCRSGLLSHGLSGKILTFQGGSPMPAYLVRLAICASMIVTLVLPAYGLTSQEVVAKLEAAGYSQIREMKSGKIMTYKAVRAGKEVSLIVDSFGKFKELP